MFGVQRRERGGQQILRAFRYDGGLAGGGGRLESIAHACLIGGQCRRAVGHRLCTEIVGEIVGVSAARLGGIGGIRVQRGHAILHGRRIIRRAGNDIGAHATLRHIRLHFLICRHQLVVAELFIGPPRRKPGLSDDAPAHQIERIVHAHDQTIVGRLRCARHDLRRELGQQRGQADTAGIGDGGVTGRERTSGGERVIAGVVLRAGIVRPHRQMDDILGLRQTGSHIVAIRAIRERTRMDILLLHGGIVHIP